MAVKVGDTVLAYHGVMIYDAKVLKVDNGQGVQQEPGAGGQASASTQYYLHYQGWAKKWDEWVRHDRVLEDTPANRALQQKAKEDMAKAKKEKRLAKKKKISSAGVDAPSARKSPFKRLKRSVENDYEEFLAPGRAATATRPPRPSRSTSRCPSRSRSSSWRTGRTSRRRRTSSCRCPASPTSVR